MNNKVLEWRNFMIAVLLWITMWEVWRASLQSFSFGKKYYSLICFIVLVILTIYVFYSDISWHKL